MESAGERDEYFAAGIGEGAFARSCGLRQAVVLVWKYNG